MNPRYPVYVISKGRSDTRLTSKMLEFFECPYKIVIEPQEFDDYAAVIDESKILVLPFSNLGQGSIPARNFVWDHAVEAGAERHWILDDNIRDMYRLDQNRKIRLGDGTGMCVIEDLTDRYENVALSGPHYQFFAPQRDRLPPFLTNTRIYSFILIKNDLEIGGKPVRWRGRYNEDTDLSLRLLKDGWATIILFAILANKMPTMRMKGGNTAELYHADEQNKKELDWDTDGRLDMAKSLKEQHPDVTTISRKFGRWQHHVDYSQFKRTKLRFKPGVEEALEDKPNNYRLVIRTLEELGKEWG